MQNTKQLCKGVFIPTGKFEKEIYKINDNASVEDSNFLEKVKGEPSYRFRLFSPSFYDWDELPPKVSKKKSEYGRTTKPKSLWTFGIRPIIFFGNFCAFYCSILGILLYLNGSERKKKSYSSLSKSTQFNNMFRPPSTARKPNYVTLEESKPSPSNEPHF